VSLDGTRQRVTSGAGFETAAATSPAGDVIFTNAESSTTIRSMSLGESSVRSVQEAAPATLFAASKDGTRLIYGRMLGTVHGELVLHDRNTRNETILAAHDVVLSGVGSFWPQISPDGKRVIYRIVTYPHGSPRTTPPSAGAFSLGAIYMIPTEGGAPRVLVPGLDRGFALVSDWRPDGERVIGECGLVSGGICELDPRTKNPHLLLSDPQGGQLLYPSFSWDGKWVVFMLRRGGRTGIVVTPVHQDGTLAGEGQWVRISTEGVNGSRPRFAPDGSSIYYLNVDDLIGGGAETVIRQKLDPISKKPAGEPMPLASVRFSGPGVSLIAVSRDRIFFNTSEVHSNVWRTPIE
jgi:WD40-like Beta Propeller Repeat